MTTYPRAVPVGEAALSLELGDAIDPLLNARVRAVDRALAERAPTGVRECVPTYRSLLVVFDPARLAAHDLARELIRLTADARSDSGATGALHVIPTVYGGEAGPDLAETAEALGLTAEELVARHSGNDYTAFLVGFMPGFAYLGLLPEGLERPRRQSPRTRVPAGSVGIAGRQTGIYPAASPGGWNLIGRTATRMFDPRAAQPTLIEAGDRVRFQPARELAAETGATTEAFVRGDVAVTVAAPGLLTTIQDVGRPGHRRRGVTASGAADQASLRAANRALGNDEGAAAFECAVVGPTLRFLRPTRFAITGADLGAVLERDDLGNWPVPRGVAVLARAGNVLSFRGRKNGCRAYMAFAGGIDVPLILGSRSTDLMSGFGGHDGRALRTDDRLALGVPSGRESRSDSRIEDPEDVVTVDVILGPQHDHFNEDALSSFLGQTWTIEPFSDRLGYRLRGEAIPHLDKKEIVTDGMLPGCIQVPPNGQPIVMLADAPTTGGYPKIATVVSSDLGKLAQLLPGTGQVRFRAR